MRLYQPITLCISLRYLYKQIINNVNYFISWFPIITISIGIGSLIIILSVMNGFQTELEKNILNFIPQVLLTTHKKIINPKVVTEKSLPRLFNVIKISPLITNDVILQSKNNLTTGLLLSTNSSKGEPLSAYTLNKNLDKLINSSYKIVISNILANELDVTIGDQVRLIMPDIIQFTPLGFIPRQRIFKICDIYLSPNISNSHQVLINQQDAALLMQYPVGYITGWRLWLKKPLKIANVIKKTTLPKGLIWHDWREYKGELFKAISIEKNVMILMISLIIILGISNIFVTLNLFLIEKRTEIAILKIQGLTNNKIIFIFITRNIIIVLIGSIFGICSSFFILKFLNDIIHFINKSLSDINLPSIIDPIQIVIVLLLTILLVLICTLYSSWSIIRHSAKILQYE